MGFSDATRRDPPTEAKNVVEMGFSMIECLRAFRKEQKDPSDQSADIDMRIGIHIVIFGMQTRVKNAYYFETRET